jgi:purine-binding chemotaxis protein CheW
MPTPEPPPLRILVWHAGAVRCGAPITSVQEVLAVPPVTPIPGTPAAVRGVANVRGELVTIVDGRRLVDQPGVGRGEDLVLVRVAGRLIGLEVDRVDDLHAVAADAAEPDPAGAWHVPISPAANVRLLDLDALLGPLFPEHRSIATA